MKDNKDFDRLFRLHYNQLFLFAKTFISVDEDCHDLVNDVFEEVWIHYAMIKEEVALQYMYTCLRRRCLDRLRRQKVEQRYMQLHSLLTERYTTMEGLREVHERERIVEEVISSLPPPTQDIFTLCYVEHKKYQEVAELLGISPSTVKKHISRALQMISERRQLIADC